MANRRRYVIAIFLLLQFITSGCAYFSSQKTALQNVHETYRAEFAQFMAPPAPENLKPTLNKALTDESAFAKSLREIRRYKLKYGAEKPASRHLQILEGMIYLQCGRLGMASLIQDDVEKAAQQLRSKNKGYYVRDFLLGISFGYLIQGWREVYDYDDEDDNSLAEFKKLEAAAAGIARQLQSLEAAKFSDPEVDQGGIYLATTAAIFYVWVHSLRDEANTPDTTNWFARGRDLIGKFLTEKEKQLATRTEKFSHAAISRLRYLDWYGFLDQKAGR